MKITKSQLRKLIKEEMRRIRELKPGTTSELGPEPGDPPFKRGPTFRDRIAPIEYQNSTREKGGRLSDIARKALENADERARKKGELHRPSGAQKGKWHMYEGNEAEEEMKAEVESIATEIFYAAEDWIDDPQPGGGIERLEALGIGYNQKEHLKGSLLEFLRDFTAKLAGMEAKESATSDRVKPWLKLKPFEEEINLEEKWKNDYETPKSKEGDCTPMSKASCTPRRKAFARRAKAGWPKGEGSTPGYKK